jgi:formate dehydrogenase accessory protein FdhE
LIIPHCFAKHWENLFLKRGFVPPIGIAGVSYLNIEGDRSGAKAESCAQCRTYLKLFYLESSPSVEPFADDAATITLDILMEGEGFSRTGMNLFVLGTDEDNYRVGVI